MTQTCSCGNNTFICVGLYCIRFQKGFETIFPATCDKCCKSVKIKADFYIEKELSHEKAKQQPDLS